MTKSSDQQVNDKLNLDNSYSTDNCSIDCDCYENNLISDYTQLMHADLDREFDRMFASGFELC